MPKPLVALGALAALSLGVALAPAATAQAEPGPVAVRSFGGPSAVPDVTELPQRDLIEAALALAEGRAGKPFSPAFRARATQQLAALDATALAALTTDSEAALAPLLKTLGSPTGDLVFTPIPPCRVLDTRSGSGHLGPIVGPLAPGTNYAFDATSGYACGAVPFPDAKALAVNLVAILPAGAGNLQMWAWDNTLPGPPTTSVINYQALSPNLNIANGLIMPLCNTATATGGSCGDDLLVRANISAVHLVMDVTGYFSAPEKTRPWCFSMSTEYSELAQSAALDATVDCPDNAVVTGGGYHFNELYGNGDVIVVRGLYPETVAAGFNRFHCKIFNPPASGQTPRIICEAFCCYIAGR